MHDPDTTQADDGHMMAQWAAALWLGWLLILPAGLYFAAQLYDDARTVAPALVYCTLFAWFRLRDTR